MPALICAVRQHAALPGFCRAFGLHLCAAGRLLRRAFVLPAACVYQADSIRPMNTCRRFGLHLCAAGRCFGGLWPCLRRHTYYTIFCGCMHAGGGPRGLFRGLHILSTHSLQTVQASIKLYSHSSCNIIIATRAHHIGKRKAQAPSQAPCALVLRAACGTPLPNARRGLPKEPCAGRSPLHKGTKQAGPPVMLLCMGPPGGNRQSFGTAEGFYIN